MFFKMHLKNSAEPSTSWGVEGEGGMTHAHYKGPFMELLQGFLDCQGIPRADAICTAEVCIFDYVCVFVCVCVCVRVFVYIPYSI